MRLKFTGYVEVEGNGKLNMGELKDYLSDYVILDLEDGRPVLSEKRNVVGVALAWETLKKVK